MVMAEEEYQISESNWGSRAGAYFIDLLIIFTITFAIFILLIPNFLIFLPFPFGNILFFFIFWVVVGIISVIYSGAFEGGLGTTIGKGSLGLEVFSLDTEAMTAGKGFKRSVSKIAWFLVPIDIAAGRGKGDPRQRALDISANTIVAEMIPASAPEPERSPYGGRIYVKPLEGEEGELGEGELTAEDIKGLSIDQLMQIPLEKLAKLPIPKELLTGKCPYCGTPYNIVRAGDKTTWTGLWNQRCIWCNRQVFEPFRRRVEPGRWL